MHSRIRDNYITILFILPVLLLCNIFIISSSVAAQGEQLFIYMTNEDYEEIDEIYEGENFLVSTYTLNENSNPVYQIDVEIEFDGNTSQITTEYPEIALKAPQISEDTPYIIKASKDGYISAERIIIILNKLPKLIVTLDKDSIEANEQFFVTVTDDTENKNPIADATVAIQDVFGEGAIATTNSGGRAWLVAPEVKGEITIMAQKDGYVEGTTPLMVNIGPGFWESLLQNPDIFIILAVIVVIAAIVFVNFRQRKHIDIGAREISKEQALTRYGAHGKIVSLPSSEKTGKPVDQYGSRGPKIEEIRISRPRKDKKIVSVKIEKEEARKVIPRKTIRKHDYDWFEGTDDIRYEIDRITGEIDEEGLDKWFEGIDDIRAKIDEKIKKKDKKKGK